MVSNHGHGHPKRVGTIIIALRALIYEVYEEAGVQESVSDSDQKMVSVTSSMDTRLEYTIYTDMQRHRQMQLPPFC